LRWYFLAIGHKPNTDLFKDQLDTNENGYLLTKSGTKQILMVYTPVAMFRIMSIDKQLQQQDQAACLQLM